MGKSHLATGLALAACRQGYKVRFWTTASLVNELLQAQDEYQLQKVLTSVLTLNLVVLDELVCIPFIAQDAQLLFTPWSELYVVVTVTITTNLMFADWVQNDGDERLTTAFVDRLSHHASIIEVQNITNEKQALTCKIFQNRLRD